MEIHSIGNFILGKTLGSGTTGKVKLAFHKETGAKVAIKIFKKDMLTTNSNLFKKVEREIAVMKILDHPNVMKLYDVYESSKYLFLVLEYVEGGELFDYLIKKGKLDQDESKEFFHQIVSGLEYCHSHYICHRDLKPENILLTNDKTIKLADFGMASLMKGNQFLQTSCGSPHYASPEVIMGVKYDGRKADIWSCGVILFALQTGKLPFDDDNISRLLGKVKTGIFSMPTFLPKDSKDLISKMLTVDPNKRITIAEIKQHPWFTSYFNPHLTPANDMDSIQNQTYSDLGEEIIRSLHSLGWQENLEQILKDPKPSLEKIFYGLLLQRKRNPPKPNAAQPQQRNGSPVPRSEPISIGNNNSNGIQIMSNSLNVSNSHPTSPMQIEPTKISSSFGEKPNFLSQRRFQRLKLNQPNSPIVGSSPKRSWFSAFFQKSEKEPPPKNEAFGIVSKKLIEVIMIEIQRVFSILNLKIEILNARTLRAYSSTQNGSTSTLIVEILDLQGNDYFINFEPETGPIELFNAIIEQIEQLINL